METNNPQLFQSLPLESIDENPFQPRKKVDDEALQSLIRSIRSVGLLQPITVRPASNRFQVITGWRRRLAFTHLQSSATTEEERARYSTIPSIIVEDISDAQLAASALVENMERDDLTPIEAAVGLNQLRELNTLLRTAADLATFTGLSEDRIQRLMTLLSAPALIRDAVSTGRLVTVGEENSQPRTEQRRLEQSHALALTRFYNQLLKVPGGNGQALAESKTEKCIRRVLNEGWTFRRLERFIASETGAPKQKRPRAESGRGGQSSEMRVVAPTVPSNEPGEITFLSVLFAPFRALHLVAMLMRLWLWFIHSLNHLVARSKGQTETLQAPAESHKIPLSSNAGGSPKKAA